MRKASVDNRYSKGKITGRHGHRQAGFTLVETLVVLGIIGVLAGILFPVLSSVKEAGRKASCLSNEHQIGLAGQLYSTDSDDRTPGTSQFVSGGVAIPIGFGWAGKINPYAKSGGVFACGTDDTPVDAGIAAPGSVRISYGANDNLSSINLSQAASASRTVLLFEVKGAFASISKPDEGASSRAGVYTKYSPVSNGIKGGIVDSALPWPGLGNGISTTYATGLLDNSDNSVFADDFGDADGRHSAGSNFLALDGHSVWSKGGAISAGAPAKTSSDPQSSTGCSIVGSPKLINLPCAEGTAKGSHRLTFSRE